MDGDNDQNKNNLNPEEKKEVPKEFGNVIDALHSKQKISSLRTFQGDMAEYIKEKSESVVSVALKEKERKENREEAAGVVYQTPKPKRDGIQINLTIIITSIILIFGAVAVSIYIYGGLKAKSSGNTVVEEALIPYNNATNLTNITKENIGAEISKTENPGGINIFKISDVNNVEIKKAQDFFNLMAVFLPGTLERTLKDDYVLGNVSSNGETAYFLVISVSDFGVAFSGMLEWEASINNDLVWFNTADANLDQSNGSFMWKDLIVKNKDIRALVNDGNYSPLAYTFLDKNTILITNNISSIGDIALAYASRPVAR